MGDDTNKPNVSDVQGGVRSTAKDAPAAKADFSEVQSKVASTADHGTIYQVKPGDSLSRIASHFYGDAHDWKTIFEANRDQLADPDRIHPGQMLKIPAPS